MTLVRGFCGVTPEYWSSFCRLNSMGITDICRSFQGRLEHLVDHGKVCAAHTSTHARREWPRLLNHQVCNHIDELYNRPGVPVCRDPSIQCKDE